MSGRRERLVNGVDGAAIKRYDNRKLYDTAARRYVTMSDLAKKVGRGEDVRVQDQKTGADITTVVLAQALFEAVKQRTADVPRQVLARIIRLGSRQTSPRAPPPPPDLGARAREEAERIVSGLLARGRLSLEEALSLRQEIAGALHRITSDLQRSVESRLHGLLSLDGPNSQASLDKLRERLLAFETYLTAPPRRPRGRR